jgi:hypothetical protein
MELVTVSVQSQIAELDQRMHDDESNPIDLVVRRKNLISTLERAETLFDATMKAAEADHKRIEELIHKQQTRMKQEQQQQELWLRCERKIMVFTEHALRLREAAVERKNSKQVHRLEAGALFHSLTVDA